MVNCIDSIKATAKQVKIQIQKGSSKQPKMFMKRPVTRYPG